MSQNYHSPDGLLILVLSRLSLDTIYRLYGKSSLIRRLTENQLFWKRLIERDLKIVPQFKVDYKLHYLRATGVPIGGKILMEPLPMYEKQPDYRNVVSLLGNEIYALRDGTVINRGRPVNIPKVERIKQMFVDLVSGQEKLLAYSGNVYNFRGQLDRLDDWEHGAVAYVGGQAVITVDGRLFKWAPKGYRQVPLPSKAIYLRGSFVLTDQGEVYDFNLVTGEMTHPKRSGVNWIWGGFSGRFPLMIDNNETFLETDREYPRLVDGPAIGLGRYGYINSHLKFISMTMFNLGKLPNKSILQIFASDSLREPRR